MSFSSQQVVIYVLVALGGLSVTFLIMVIALRLQFIRRQRLDSVLLAKWEPLVMGYLIDETTADEVDAAIGASHHAKDLFSGLMSDYLVNLRGEEHVKLVELVDRIGLADHEIASLRARAPWRRAVAAMHLRLIGNERAIPALRDGLFDVSPVVQIACADSLSALNDLDSLETVTKILLTQTAWNRMKTADILVAYGRAAPDRLEPFGFDEDIEPDRRALVIEVLGTIGYRATAKRLLHMAEETPNPEVITAVVKYIGLTTGLDGLPFLLQKLDDADWVVRSQAAKSLGKIGDPSVVDALLRLIRDPVWWVRYQSATALASIIPEGVIALEEAGDSEDKFAGDIARQALYEAGELREDAA